MSQWLPARIRIAYYQMASAYNYKRARMQRNARKSGLAAIFGDQARIDAERGRALLFEIIDKRLPASYDGELKGDSK